MTALAHLASIKLANKTLAAIEAASVAQDDGLRPHLGASQIGRPCSRQLWYAFRWCKKPSFEGRMMRLFERGQREEDILVSLLRKIGATVSTHAPATGKQYAFGDAHFGGSMDGAAKNLPDAPKTWHVLEFKTHNIKSFKLLEKSGVKEAKPEHYSQMQMYMHWTGMTRALYLAVCKDDDRLHAERIDHDAEHCARLIEKADYIVFTPEPPPGISADPSYYLCKMCDMSSLCHGTDAPLPTCRSCLHSTPEKDGTWSCAHLGLALGADAQKQGCDAHRFIPSTLGFAECTGADAEKNLVFYRMKNGAGEFVNGATPEGYASHEIHAAHDKMFLLDPVQIELRKNFGGRIVG